MNTPILETERLILRPLTMDDAQTAFDRWTSDKRVAKYMIWTAHKSIDETLGWLKFASETVTCDTKYDWGIVEKDNGYLFGSCSIYFKENIGLYEIGYGIMYDHWNKGYTTEATKAMIDFAKENLNVKQLYAQHHVDNPASGKVMIKNGFVPTGHGEFTTFNGDVRKSRTYILDL